MIDVALVRLVGSGLALMAEGYGETVPQGAAADGFQLVAFMARCPWAQAEIASFTSSIVGDIWQQWALAGLPNEVALAHLDALPAIIDRYRPDDGLLTSMTAAALAAARQGKPMPEPSVRIAEAILTNARRAGGFAQQGLSEPLLHFFIERLLARLFADIGMIEQLRPLLHAYLAGEEAPPAPPIARAERVAAASQAAATETARSPATAAIAEDEPQAQPVPVAADDGTTAAPTAAAAPGGEQGATGAPQLPADEIERLITHLDAAAGALLPETRDLLARARACIAAADLDAALAVLVQIEDAHVRAAQTDLPGSHALLRSAADMRGLRGAIAGLCGEWRKAARHYAAAARCLHQGDRQGRRHFLTRQAEALVGEGGASGDLSALAEAVPVYAAAVSNISEREAPLEWAGMNASLGSLLLLLGRNEARPERFRVAALHFKPAIDVYSRERVMEEWARAQLGLARSLQALGEVQGDVVMLAEAIFAYRAVIAMATPDRLPEEWAAALLGLGATLVMQGEETGAPESLEQAAAAYRMLLAAPTAAGQLYDAGEISQRLGDVLLKAVAAASDGAVLREAEAAFARAIASYEAAGRTLDAAGARSRRGTALWALGELHDDVDVLADAARAKLAALDIYEAAAAEGDALLVRGELAALERAIEARSRIAPATAAA